MSEEGKAGEAQIDRKGPGRPPREQPKNRPDRVPLGQRGRLTYDAELLKELKSQGLVPRLVSDKPGRIADALRAGYRFVQSDGKIGDEKAGDPSSPGAILTAHIGSGENGFLMVIPKEFYEEDQKAKQDQVDATEEAMKAPATLGPGTIGKTYGPGLTKE